MSFLGAGYDSDGEDSTEAPEAKVQAPYQGLKSTASLCSLRLVVRIRGGGAIPKFSRQRSYAWFRNIGSEIIRSAAEAAIHWQTKPCSRSGRPKRQHDGLIGRRLNHLCLLTSSLAD